jgi:hypothetical protein
MQLTRLFNNEASDIILLVNHSEPLSWWLNQIEDMKSNWRKPKIHLIQSVIVDLVRNWKDTALNSTHQFTLDSLHRL